MAKSAKMIAKWEEHFGAGRWCAKQAAFSDRDFREHLKLMKRFALNRLNGARLVPDQLFNIQTIDCLSKLQYALMSRHLVLKPDVSILKLKQDLPVGATNTCLLV